MTFEATSCTAAVSLAPAQWVSVRKDVWWECILYSTSICKLHSHTPSPRWYVVLDVACTFYKIIHGAPAVYRPLIALLAETARQRMADC